MNRSPIVERALFALVILSGFALVYGLPMLALDFAVGHGWYVTAASTLIPVSRAVRSVPHAFWIDGDGREHEVESITPHRAWRNWLLARFASPDREPALVQRQHVVVRAVDPDRIDVLHTAVIDDRLEVSLERFRDAVTVTFDSAHSLGVPEIDVEHIPDLIDALTVMHRSWLHAGGAA